MTSDPIEVVNIAAKGDFGREIDIRELAEAVDLPVSRYDPQSHAAFFRLQEDEQLLILYRTGKYILRGGDDFDQMMEAHEGFLETFEQAGLEHSFPELTVKNIVAVGDLEREVNLNALSIGIGLEHTEYEPEQFPGVVYRPENTPCVLLVFSNGRVVITGGPTREDALSAFLSLCDTVDAVLS